MLNGWRENKHDEKRINATECRGQRPVQRQGRCGVK